jgi:IMP dehydrogenase
MSNIKIVEGYSYDDILITPKYSDKTSRKNISLKTNITKNVSLNLPLVSSNMDTITEDKMAIEMALQGGIGIIHRFCSIEDQVAMVKKVKRHTHHIIQNPYTIQEEHRIPVLLAKVLELDVYSFLVLNEKEELSGIVTKRDLDYYEKNKKCLCVKDIMTPIDKLIIGDKDIRTNEAVRRMLKHRVEKLPLVNSKRKVEGLLTIKDILHHKKIYNISTVDGNGCLRVGAAVGINKDYLERTTQLIMNDCDIIVVDVAHGHHSLVKTAIESIKKLANQLDKEVDIIGGNVCTPEGTDFLCKLGVDGVKVGVGPGSICTTRIQTGCGYPQFSAVMNCAEVAAKYEVPIIADGGHRGKIGNIVKALAAGSSSSMLGGFVAGTTETPGNIMIKGNKKVKMIRGMAGRVSNLNKSIKNNESIDIENMIPEGVEGYVSYKGRVKYILDQMRGGIQSGLSYCGVDSIEDLHKTSIEFVKLTSSGKEESGSHDISEI